ncbi:MAG: hypothetical protein MSH30_01030 [Campylobacter sp.]|nr:hypothetical protein [Campylobacter sp.]
MLEKSAQNSLERYRYGAPRLVLHQNSKNHLTTFEPCFTAATAKLKGQREFWNSSKLEFKTKIPALCHPPT